MVHFMVMNSDARHPKEFSTENTSGGDAVLSCGPTTALLGRGGRQTMRYDATGSVLTD